jgi:hypothetical protein
MVTLLRRIKRALFPPRPWQLKPMSPAQRLYAWDQRKKRLQDQRLRGATTTRG